MAERKKILPLLPLRDIVVFPAWWSPCSSGGTNPSRPSRRPSPSTA